MSYYDDHKAIALLVQSSARPVSDKDLAAFKEARAKYQDKVKFFMLDPVAERRASRCRRSSTSTASTSRC